MNSPGSAQTIEHTAQPRTKDCPIIDAANLFSQDARRRSLAGKEILHACHSHGYFSVENSGINNELVGRVIEQAGNLFSLPDSDPRKQAINSNTTAGGLGWSELFSEPAYTAGTIAHMESFDCGPYRGDIEKVDCPEVLGLYPSCWPGLKGFRKSVREYWDRQQELGAALYHGFARALALDENFFTGRCSAAAPSTMRLIHYPENDAPRSGPNVGISEHSDFECFTVIYQTAPGLELLDVNGKWVQAPVKEGQFIVLIGDMLERWSNGYITATRHRVPNTPWARNSIVMFFAADADCHVQPLETYVNRNNAARFAPVTQAQHISWEIEQAEFNRLELARLTK